MSTYDNDWLERLKEKLDIVQVVSKYVRLTKRGKNFVGLCPFHREKTPSFYVNPDEQYYHCFGCGEGGDAFKFVRKMESCEFKEAMELLADSVGLKVPDKYGDFNGQERKNKKDRILKILEIANQHYQNNLKKESANVAIEYMKKRGLTPELIKKFGLGFSDGWTAVIKELSKQGFTADQMKEAGVIEIKNNSAYDILCNRLTFPLFNTYGDCVGFSARILDNTDHAKYLNTPDTPLFSKGNTIFGIQFLKQLRNENELNEIILVEGQMDVIAMHKANFENAVASLGTAFTINHAKQLKRFCNKVVVCLDGDFAGTKAAYKAVDVLMEAGLEPKVVYLPNNQDPDEFLAENSADRFKFLVENAESGIDFQIQQVAKGLNLKANDQRAKFVKIAINIVSKLETTSEQRVFLEQVSKLSGVPIDVLQKDIKPKDISQKMQIFQNEKLSGDATTKATNFVLASLLHKKDYANFNYDMLKIIKNETLKKLYIFLKESAKNNQKVLVGSIYLMFEEDEIECLDAIINFNFNGIETGKYYLDCINLFEEFEIREKQEELMQKFKNSTNTEERRKFAVELADTAQKLKDKKGKIGI
ncbi:MAG: DNA primase [Clostridia bacterium]